MADSPRPLLPPAGQLSSEIIAEFRAGRIELPDGVRITVDRRELHYSEHMSISPEVAAARAHEAREMSERARYEFAVPAIERSTQVRSVGVVVVAVVVVTTIGAALRPESATAIASIGAIASAIFGGIYIADRRRPDDKDPGRR